MLTFSPPAGAFDSGELMILEDAFNSVWATLIAHRHPYRSPRFWVGVG